MTDTEFESYHDDPDYQSALNHFQEGDWERGLSELDRLIKQYPLEDELRALRQEMAMRAEVDRSEGADRRSLAMKRFTRIGVRVVVAALIIIPLVLFVTTYNARIRAAVDEGIRITREAERKAELRSRDIACQRYLASFRPEECAALIEEIRELDPEYSQISELEEAVENQRQLFEDYEQAKDLIEQGDYQEALFILQELEKVNPKFPDLRIVMLDLQNTYLLRSYLDECNLAFQAGEWVDAIEQCDKIQQINLEYEREQVERKLYDSYINAAQDIINNIQNVISTYQDSADDETQVDILDAVLDEVNQADEYYFKALALRPRDEAIYVGLREVRERVNKALFDAYLFLAETTLEQSEQVYALDVQQQVTAYYQQAYKIRPNDPLVNEKIMMAQSYINAQRSYLDENWDAVIDNLEFVYRQDPDYAAGVAEDTLYNAYIARGNRNQDVGLRTQAEADYRRAIEIARNNPDNLSRNFEAKVALGKLQRVMGFNGEASIQFREALADAKIFELLVLDPEFQEVADEADNFFTRNRMNEAASVYSDLVDRVREQFPSVIIVYDGTDPGALPNQFCTTLQDILKANQIRNLEDLLPGERLEILYITCDN
jgi:tetratricopeptide (TPR) repeat protein